MSYINPWAGPKTYAMYRHDLAVLTRREKSQRAGQLAYNTLHGYKPELARAMAAGPYDPFYLIGWRTSSHMWRSIGRMTLTQEEMKNEARVAIIEGRSKPIREWNPRAREHEIRLKNGETIRVIYDRTKGEVVKLLPADAVSPSWK